MSKKPTTEPTPFQPATDDHVRAFAETLSGITGEPIPLSKEDVINFEALERENANLRRKLKDTHATLTRRIDCLLWYIEVLSCDAEAVKSAEYPKGMICPDPHIELLYMHADSFADLARKIEPEVTK